MFRSKWWRFVPFLPLVVLLCGVNVFGDAGNILHSPVDAMVETLLDGYPAYVSSGNLDDIELRYRYICRMPDDVECIILGGSTTMCVSSSDVGEAKFVNLGHSHGRLDDAAAQIGAIIALGKDKHLKRVIFVPNEWYFAIFPPDEESFPSRKAIKPYCYYMNNLINGKGEADKNIPEAEFSENTLSFNPIFSLAYFQANLSYILDSKMMRTERSGVVDDKYEGYYYMPDGSYVYSITKTTNNENDVIRDAERTRYNDDENAGRVDSEKWDMFIKLVEYLTSRGIKIDLYLSPLAPALWKRIAPDRYAFLHTLEDNLVKLAEKYSMRIIGSYNPQKSGITNADFYDIIHIRRESISKYFNLKPVVND